MQKSTTRAAAAAAEKEWKKNHRIGANQCANLQYENIFKINKKKHTFESAMKKNASAQRMKKTKKQMRSLQWIEKEKQSERIQMNHMENTMTAVEHYIILNGYKIPNSMHQIQVHLSM